MSENETDQEPSIEEILASIRQIISDDDEEKPAEAAPEEAAAEPELEPEPEDDVLELTESMQEDPPEPEPEPEIEIDLMDNEPEEDLSSDDDTDSADILSDVTREATLAAMAKLSGGMPVSRSRGYEGTTLEDIVRELLHPMLREWMDGNLPKMVERLVQKELEKLARRAIDD